jgi:hypothetical protein
MYSTSFKKSHIKILVRDFSAEVGREDVFNHTVGNLGVQETSNDNVDRVVNFATSKNLLIDSTMSPHRNIYNYTCTSADG